MSYPTSLKLFRAWAKAMEQGARVGNPDYTKRHQSPAAPKVARRTKVRSRRFRRKRRSKED